MIDNNKMHDGKITYGQMGEKKSFLHMRIGNFELNVMTGVELWFLQLDYHFQPKRSNLLP